MSDDAVITVRNVSKCYLLYDRPQDRLKQSLFWRLGKNYAREFWALRDVSFEVRKGERLAVIGRNGAGKSTLLQILAGTLSPTVGEVQIRGRVAALLELGSGFNPEYTGRENVRMNATILGLSPQEIAARLEEIIAFADIGNFIDQPVKLYSTGMLVRLAFAVTTGVDADVLLIDEALAVGDVFFRQKCYKRLNDLRDRGVTVVLVSHAMTEVEQFCQRAILLDQGTIVFQGDAYEAVRLYYLIGQSERVSIPLSQPSPAPVAPLQESKDLDWPSPDAFLDISSIPQVSNGWARCTGVALCNQQGLPCHTFQQGETASFFYEFELLQDIEVPIGGLVIQNDKGIVVHGKSTLEYGSEVPTWVTAGSRLRFRQDIKLELAVGEYTFEVGLAMIGRYDFEYRGRYTHSELGRKIIRLCHLPKLGPFAIVFRQNGAPVQLLHHGVANLPGTCRVRVEV